MLSFADCVPHPRSRRFYGRLLRATRLDAGPLTGLGPADVLPEAVERAPEGGQGRFGGPDLAAEAGAGRQAGGRGAVSFLTPARGYQAGWAGRGRCDSSVLEPRCWQMSSLESQASEAGP